MDDTTLRIAVGLRLGRAISVAPLCHHCGDEDYNAWAHMGSVGGIVRYDSTDMPTSMTLSNGL